MTLKNVKKLGLAGALAAAGLVLAPLAASADINKCGKEIAKNAAKVTSDVQKELQKCVDGWQKEVDKTAANLGKGKTLGDGAAKGQVKAVEKCAAGLVKIGLDGTDVSTQAKSKMGKPYSKIAAALQVANKKCGPKNGTQAEADQELAALGWLGFGTFGDASARLAVMAGFAQGWDLMNALNQTTAGDFAAMAHDRCSVSGVECDASGNINDCPQNPSNTSFGTPGKPDPTDVCQASACPDCARLGRTDKDQGSGAPGGAFVGPCHASQCKNGGATVITTNSAFLGLALPVALTGSNPSAICDIPELLPGAIGVTGGPARGITATLFGLGVCVDAVRATGYFIKDTTATTLPAVDVFGCADVDTSVDLSGAGAADACGAGSSAPGAPFSACAPAGVDDAGVNCQDAVTAAGARVNGDAVVSNTQRITAATGPGDPCLASSTFMPGEPAANVLTTHDSQATIWDVAGPGTSPTGSGTFSLATGVSTGVPFDLTALSKGDQVGTLSGAFSAVNDDPMSILGHSTTGVVVECVP